MGIKSTSNTHSRHSEYAGSIGSRVASWFAATAGGAFFSRSFFSPSPGDFSFCEKKRRRVSRSPVASAASASSTPFIALCSSAVLRRLTNARARALNAAAASSKSPRRIAEDLGATENPTLEFGSASSFRRNAGLVTVPEASKRPRFCCGCARTTRGRVARGEGGQSGCVSREGREEEATTRGVVGRASRLRRPSIRGGSPSSMTRSAPATRAADRVCDGTVAVERRRRDDARGSLERERV